MKVLVVDNGFYVELALTLGRSGLFDKVGYYCRWEDDFPFTKDAVVGAGFDEITREMDLFPALAEYDAFVFPDNYWSGCQAFIKAVLNKPVWGSGWSEELELDRRRLRRMMKDWGLPVPKYHIARGLPYLLEDENLDEGDFIKISRYRGLMETTKFEGWDSPDWLWDMAKELGPIAHDFEFVIEKPLEGTEIGFDGIVVRNKLLYPCLLGIEKKDAGYLGKVVSGLPAFQSRVLSGIEAMLDVDYSNFLSVELRGPVLLDICTRMPQPPSHGMLSLFKNIPYIINAELSSIPDYQPVFDEDAKWLCMIMLKRAEPLRYTRVKLSDKAKKYAKFVRQFKYQNELWISPANQPDTFSLGSVSGFGSTPEEAFKMCKDVMEGVESDDVTTTGMQDGYDELMQSWEDADKEGVS